MEKVKFVRYNTLSLYNRENKETARLDWCVRGGFPRITVYTSDKAFVDGKPDYNHIIIAPFDIITLGYLIANLELCSNAKSAINFRVDCYNTKVVDGKRTNEKYVQSSVEIGKDDEGVIYIKVSEDKKPTIKFNLLPNLIWFKYYDSEGKVIDDKGFLSKIFTRGYIKTLRDLILNNPENYRIATTMLDPPNIIREMSSPIVKEKDEKPIESKSKDIDIKENNDLEDILKDI